MKITPRIKTELRRILWDYSVPEQTLWDIFEGKTSTFSLTQEKLYARLMMSTPWYRLIDCFGIQGLKEMLTDRTIQSIWIKDIQKKLFYAKEMLHGLS
jgi:hypothetical protein